ncbi:MAG: hypothetical protein FRX49_07263 [Trebouxia sp. A1-2]|nr:MAG: hypothetical protein FRX49_07263 [Trebouxia sp. A1-2]
MPMDPPETAAAPRNAAGLKLYRDPVVDLAGGAGLLLPHAVQGAFSGGQLLLLPPNDGLLSSGLLFGHAQVVLHPSSCCWRHHGNSIFGFGVSLLLKQGALIHLTALCQLLYNVLKLELCAVAVTLKT